MLIEAKNRGDVRTTDRTPTSYTFQVTNCGCDLCSATIISRAATGTVGSRKFQLPLWIASCSVHRFPRPAVTLTFTWPRTFIMLHFATHTHDVPAFSTPAFSSPAFSASPSQVVAVSSVLVLSRNRLFQLLQQPLRRVFIPLQQQQQ